MPQVQGPDMLLVIRRGIGQGRRKAFMSAVDMTLVAGFVTARR
jgi:threonine/homoserine/homoserine lactone efflux protein